jgi:nucleotide-binding universal stress UspA family protein
MQVIIGTAGLRMDLLSPAGYTILVAVSIGSSVLVSPALRRLVGNWPGSREEQRRLAHEERLRNSVLVRGQRLLVPTAVSPRPDLAAALLDRAWPPEAELTVLSAPGRDGQVRVGPLKRPIRERTSLPGDPLAGLLAEANLGYGIIGLGLASSVPVDGPGARGSVGGAERSGDLVGLLNATPLPILIVRAGTAAPASGLPARRVAIAVTGTAASLAAEELAIGLCAREGESLHIVHVVPTAGGAASGDRDGDNEGDGEDAADRVLVAARQRAARAGVEARVERRTAATASAGLADYARDVDIDLLVVGTRLRRVGNAPFLGHTVEGLLREVTVTSLAIVALPETATTEDQPYTARRHA